VSPTSDWTSGFVGGGVGTATSDGTYPLNRISISKNWSKSGYLTVLVNGIPSGNNLNSNPNAAKTINLQNDEATSDPRTRQWNDDRYLWVWGTQSVSITTPLGFTLGAMSYSHPDMVINQTTEQPEFSWNDINGGNTLFNETDDTARRRYGFRVTRPAAMAMATVAGNPERFILSGMDAVLSAAGDLDSGYFELTGFSNQTVDGYTDGASPSTAADGQKWMTIQGNDYYGDTGIDTKDYRAFERFQHPKILAGTSDVAGGGADIYVTYYDASPFAGFRNLNFVSFRTNGQRAGNLTYPSNDYSRSPDVLVIPGTADGHASPYYDMVKIGTSGIAIAYRQPYQGPRGYDAYTHERKQEHG